MSETRTRGRWAAAGVSIASALALVAAMLTFGPATGVGSAAAEAGVHAAATPTPTNSGATNCLPSGEGGSTCTGSFSGDNAWDNYGGPNGVNGGTDGTQVGGQQLTASPAVTVDQTVNLTNQIVHVSWANFTPSAYFGSTAGCDLTLTIQMCNGYKQGQEYYPVYVLECKGATPSDPSACNTVPLGSSEPGAPGTAIESYTQSGKSSHATDCSPVPADTVCGTGFADMQIQTQVENQTLGCSSSQACSLVVVPNWGGANDTVLADCENHLSDLWWGNNTAEDSQMITQCDWNDRIMVPLSFAPTPKQFCGSNKYAFYAQGSALLERTMSQWQPGWCTGVSGSGKVNFNYNSSVSEDAARSLFLNGGNGAVTSGTDVALVTDPPGSDQTAGSSRQFTYAPIATTSIDIAYYVDNQTTQEPITDLKLNARLVAKLLTESYSLAFGTCPQTQITESDLCDPAVKGNPVSLFTDPEFYQLNPQYTEADFQTETNGATNNGDFLPVVMGGPSDLTYELTRWVESDPEARAFLMGQPDQWGTHVNTYYEQGKSQTYPTSQFETTLDPGFTATPAEVGSGSPQYPFFSTMQVAWNSLTGLNNVAANLANWTPSGDAFAGTCTNPASTLTQCTGGPNGNLENLKDGVVAFPHRALFAIVDGGTGSAFRFPTAQLVNPAGNAESPNTTSMTAAVESMKTNPDGITQYQNFTNTSANSYPLTETQYAMVPSCGLSADKASAISTFLNDVANSQTYGVQLGQIPPFGGYLALTDAQQQQTLNAAQSVRQQTCKSAKQDNTVSGGTPPASTGNGSRNPNGNGNGGGTTPTTNPTGRGTGLPSASAKASATPIGLGEKAADSNGDLKYILPAALAAGALLALGGPLAYGFGTTGGFRLRFPRLRRRGTNGPGPDGPGGGIDG